LSCAFYIEFNAKLAEKSEKRHAFHNFFLNLHLDMYLKMKKTIYSKFDKKLISDLPAVLFTGRIITVISEVDADKAVDYLLSCDILGVDTETRPTFHKGRST
jgi:hypothetical protein